MEFKRHVADGMILGLSNLMSLIVVPFAGSLKPIVDSVFEFKDALKAYDRLMSGRAKGKVVVKVDSSVD